MILELPSHELAPKQQIDMCNNLLPWDNFPLKMVLFLTNHKHHTTAILTANIDPSYWRKCVIGSTSSALSTPN